MGYQVALMGLKEKELVRDYLERAFQLAESYRVGPYELPNTTTIKSQPPSLSLSMWSNRVSNSNSNGRLRACHYASLQFKSFTLEFDSIRIDSIRSVHKLSKENAVPVVVSTRLFSHSVNHYWGSSPIYYIKNPTPVRMVVLASNSLDISRPFWRPGRIPTHRKR